MPDTSTTQDEYLAIDIGGTKIQVCRYDSDYNLLYEERLATNDYNPYSMEFLSGVEQILTEYKTEKTKKIGVSFNCIVNDGVIVASSLLDSMDINYPFEKEFSEKFDMTVTLENDVISQAIAEAKVGKGKGVESFVVMNIGTGLKVVYGENGEVKKGWSGTMGEIFNYKVFVKSLKKVIPQEQVFGGKGVPQLYKRLGGTANLSTKEIFMHANNDPIADQAFECFKEGISDLFEIVSQFYNPQRIILIGGVAESSELFLSQAIKKYREKTLPFQQVDDIVVSDLIHAACLGVVL